MTEVKQDVVVVQALLNISGKGRLDTAALQIRSLHGLSSVIRLAMIKFDITRTHDDHFFSHHGIVQIHVALRYAGIVN